MQNVQYGCFVQLSWKLRKILLFLRKDRDCNPPYLRYNGVRTTENPRGLSATSPDIPETGRVPKMIQKKETGI